MSMRSWRPFDRGPGGWAVVSMTLAVAVGVPAAVAAQEPTSRVEISAVELPAELDRVLRDYETHWRARDAAALAGLFTEDGFILRPGRSAVRGRDAIRAAYTGVGGPLVLRAWDFATSGDVGWIVGGFAVETDGPAVGKFTLTLRRDAAGRWWIHSDMDNAGGR